MTGIFKILNLFFISTILSCSEKSIEDKPIRQDIIGVWKAIYAKDKVGGFEWENDSTGVIIEVFNRYVIKFEIKANNTFSVIPNDSTNENYYAIGSKENSVIFVSTNPAWNGVITKDTLELTRNVDTLWLEDRLHIYKGVKSTW